ncbi:YdcF family protein [Melioribacteraceae bacterium 4301-Me]|uniref:YdcF family protein n=1 Tax=Pyranulibacter aquaticus TaxID=3163344 RepID=UPI00359A32B0
MKKSKINIKRLSYIFLSGIINFTALIFTKYFINNLTFKEIRINYIGNIFNLIIVLLIIIGSIVYLLRYKVIENKFFRSTILLNALALVPLIFILMITENFFTFKNTFIINFPLKKALIGILFALHETFLLLLVFLIWIAFLEEGQIYFLRSLAGLPVAVSLMLIFAYGYTLLDKRENIKEKNYDLGVVFGAAVWNKDKPSPIFEGRILKAKELLESGRINKILLTGGSAPGELSESETALLFLKKRGIDTTKILLENKTKTTIEQVKYLKSEVIPELKIKSLLLISDKFHLSRVMDICSFFNVQADAVYSGHILTEKNSFNYRLKESVALLFFWFFAI